MATSRRRSPLDVKGEMLELKDTVNTMVDQLNTFARSHPRGARGRNGREARAARHSQRRCRHLEDLTDNVT